MPVGIYSRVHSTEVISHTTNTTMPFVYSNTICDSNSYYYIALLGVCSPMPVTIRPPAFEPAALHRLVSGQNLLPTGLKPRCSSLLVTVPR